MFNDVQQYDVIMALLIKYIEDVLEPEYGIKDWAYEEECEIAIKAIDQVMDEDKTDSFIMCTDVAWRMIQVARYYIEKEI